LRKNWLTELNAEFDRLFPESRMGATLAHRIAGRKRPLQAQSGARNSLKDEGRWT
jgi:hypothetical protein